MNEIYFQSSKAKESAEWGQILTFDKIVRAEGNVKSHGDWLKPVSRLDPNWAASKECARSMFGTILDIQPLLQNNWFGRLTLQKSQAGIAKEFGGSRFFREA